MDSLRGTREVGKTAWEAPGRQERINWAAIEAPGRHQGGRKEPFGQPGRQILGWAPRLAAYSTDKLLGFRVKLLGLRV